MSTTKPIIIDAVASSDNTMANTYILWTNDEKFGFVKFDVLNETEELAGTISLCSEKRKGLKFLTEISIDPILAPIDSTISIKPFSCALDIVQNCLETPSCPITIPRPRFSDVIVGTTDATIPDAASILSPISEDEKLTISWNPVTNTEIFAYEITLKDSSTGDIIDSGFLLNNETSFTFEDIENDITYEITVSAISSSGIKGPSSTTTTTLTGPSEPEISNICWGSLNITGPCGFPPDRPPETPGTLFRIIIDLINKESTNKARVVIRDAQNILFTQDNENFLSNTTWSVIFDFTMPNTTGRVALMIEVFGSDGNNFIISDRKTIIISPFSRSCSKISLDVNVPIRIEDEDENEDENEDNNEEEIDQINGSKKAKVGDIITLTAFEISPFDQSFEVLFTDRNNNILAQCRSLNGICVAEWNSAGFEPGLYFIKAVLPNQCFSRERLIKLSVPKEQDIINITVIDQFTNLSIQGAQVILDAQTAKTTDIDGKVSFNVDEDFNFIKITNPGYFDYKDTIKIEDNVDLIFSLIPVNNNPGTIHFKIIPPDVSVKLDEIIQGNTDPITGELVITDVTSNTIHNYTLSKTGFNTNIGQVNVNGGSIVNVINQLSTFSPNTGDIYLYSNPLKAKVFIDNVRPIVAGKEARTPVLIPNISPGSHTYKLSLEGFTEIINTVNVVEGQTSSINVDMEVSNTIGTLVIASNPPGARIIVDTSDTEHITPATIPISVGDHNLELKLKGFQTATPSGPIGIQGTQSTTGAKDIRGIPAPTGPQRIGTSTFTINPNQTTTLTQPLTPVITNTGSLDISSFPPGALIFIDGIDTRKITPAIINDVIPGSHTYSLSLPGYQTKSGIVDIFVGQTTTLSIALLPSPVSPAPGAGELAVLSLIGLGIIGLLLSKRR